VDYSNTSDLIKMVEQSIDASNGDNGKMPEDVVMLRGFSSPKIRRFLNHINSFGPHTYLEIGTWAGSTFIPALYDNNIKGIAIDNFSQFGVQECGGFDAREELNKNLLKYGGHLGEYRIINRDCFGMEEHERPQSQVYFYDGSHDEFSTNLGITHFGKANTSPFILIVDDWQLTPSVKIGTDKALESFNVKGEWYLAKEQGYHEGLGCFVIEPKGGE